MNKNHKYIIRKETKGQIIFIVVIILAVAIGLVWNMLEAEKNVPEWPGETTTYPMANAQIGWEQSFHYGAWGEDNAGA